MHTPYRLGLDLGTKSIGWTMVDLNSEGKPTAIRRMGSRIFSDGRDPKSGQTLAADRTTVRGQRTRRDRAIRRRDQLLLNLCRLGLLPQDAETARKLATQDPYQLRADAPQKPLPPFHLGRALMHLAKRRGFQSNRRTPAKDAEGNTKEAMKRLHEQLAGQTLGQFLYKQITEGRGARFRPSSESTDKPKKDFPLYPERAMYKSEFAATALANFSTATGTKTIRTVIKDETAKQIRHGSNRFTKAMIPGLIHSVTFWRLPDGLVDATFLSVWDANRPKNQSIRPHPLARKLFTVHKNDGIRLTHDEAEITVRVVKFEPSKGNRRIVCCGLKDADSKNSAVFIKFSSILKKNVRLLHITPIGDVRDPGPLA